MAEGAHSSLEDIAEDITAADVGRTAQEGDPLALELVREAGRLIGFALADFAHIFNPEVFVFGGGVSQLGDLLFDPIRAGMEARIMNPIYLEGLRIEPALLGDDSGLVGAMVLAADL